MIYLPRKTGSQQQGASPMVRHARLFSQLVALFSRGQFTDAGNRSAEATWHTLRKKVAAIFDAITDTALQWLDFSNKK